MNELIVKELNKETILNLYVNLNYTDKEIGDVFGVTQDAVAWKRKKYGIESIKDRDKKRHQDIQIIFEGIRRDKRKELTDEILTDLYLNKKLTDEQIGSFYGITGEAVGFRRRALNIEARNVASIRKDKNMERGLKDIIELSKQELIEELKICRGIKGVARKYNSFFGTVKDILKKEGITVPDYLKKFEVISQLQREVIIGGLLGDGGLSRITDNSYRYCEEHCIEQEPYLRWKVNILNNLVSRVVPTSSDISLGTPSLGNRFTTHGYVGFLDLYLMFYKDYDILEQKRIPEVIIENISPLSFSIWYFDDGLLIDRKIPEICTGSPVSDINKAIEILNYRYNIDCVFREGKDVNFIRFNNVEKFFELIRDFVPSCMRHKIPSEYAFKVTGLPKNIFELDKKIKEYKPHIWRDLPEEDKNKWIDDIAIYYDYVGFPEYKIPDPNDVKAEIKKISDYAISKNVIGNILNRLPPHGVELANSYFINMWTVETEGKGSAYNRYCNSEKFKRVIRKTFEYNSVINERTIRSELKRYGKVFNFKPLIAKYIYDSYCPKNGVVLDYSAGWGGRLLGAYTSINVQTYIGIDPNKQTFFNLRSFERRLSNFIRDKKTILINGCSEDTNTYKNINNVDICFSSPPYFNAEIYSKEDTQSCIKYPELSVWVDKFLKATVLNCYNVLKENGIFAINIADIAKASLQKYAYDICREFFSFEKYFIIQMPSIVGKEKYEPIFVFRKSDSKSDNPSYEDICLKMEEEFNSNKKAFYGKYKYFDLNAKYSAKGGAVLSEGDKNLSINILKKIAEEDKQYNREYVKNLTIRKFPFPVWCITKSFGSWNNFIKAAGLPVLTEEWKPLEIVNDYLKVCVESNKYLTFYEYGRLKGSRYCLKIKRLFNSGKPYHHLLDELKSVALSPERWPEFLEKFK